MSINENNEKYLNTKQNEKNFKNLDEVKTNRLNI